MSLLCRATGLKTAFNFISREVSPHSLRGSFRSIRFLGAVSIPRPPPSRPHFFSHGFSANAAPYKVNHDPPADFKETLLLDGCDFNHWFIVVDPPEGNPTRDDLIDCYVKTLTEVLGSEEEARNKIYAISTKHYFAFQCLISEETSKKLASIPHVRWVLPDSYFDPRTKSYGGEPFINGQAVPYDPKYHEEWVRNNARCNEKSRSDRPRNNDRSRNVERRRDMRQNPNLGPPPNNTYRPPQGNTRQGAPDEMRQNANQRPLPSRTYQSPQGNTMQGAPDEMRQNAYQRPPPNRSYQGPQGNTTQGAPDEMPRNASERPLPNRTYQAPQGNTMQGAPDSQGLSN